MAIASILGIHGVPRSGTSWLAQIFNASSVVALRFQPLFSYSFKDRIDLNSSTEQINLFFQQIWASDHPFINMKDPKIHKGYPEFFKSETPNHLVFKQVRYHHLLRHMLRHNDRVKFIFVQRNPLAVLASWYKAPSEFDPKWSLDQEWEWASLKNQNRPEEFFGYKKWKEANTLFLQLNQEFPERTKLIRYEQLLTETERQIDALFSFAGLSVEEQVIQFIKESRSTSQEGPNTVYRKKADDCAWKQVIPEHIQKAVQKDLHNDPLALLL